MWKRIVAYGTAAIIGIVCAVGFFDVFMITTVTGSGMEPFYKEGHYVLVCKAAYRKSIPEVGEVVALWNQVYSEDGEGSVLIRRIAARQGDQIVVQVGHKRDVQTVALDLDGSQGFQQRALEGPANGHDLTGGFHLGTQVPRCRPELVKRPLRELYDNVVENRLEAGTRSLRYIIGKFIQIVSQRDLSCDLGNRISCRLRSQSRRTAYARIYLDYDIFSRIRIQCELHVAAALDSQAAYYFNRCVTKHLIFCITQRLRRGYDDTVTCMYAYRIQVFHAADDDAVVSAVADHFVLDFLPSCYRFFQQDLSNSTVLHAFIAKHLQLFHVFCDTAACAAQCICRTNDHRKAFFLDEVVAFFHRRCDDAARDRLADLLHQLLEFFPVFRLFDAFPVNAQKLCAVCLCDPAP